MTDESIRGVISFARRAADLLQRARSEIYLESGGNRELVAEIDAFLDGKPLCQRCQKPILDTDEVYIHPGPDTGVRSHAACVGLQ